MFDNFEIKQPNTKKYSKEKMKLLQERKLVEESEIKILKELFNSNHDTEEITKHTKKDIITNLKK
jgi:uncharacterized membrane-anchored protein